VVVVEPDDVVVVVAAGPLDTTRATVAPLASFVPPAGFVLITDPNGTVVDDCCVVVTLNPSCPS
jgi:hypothetical protein